jgi:hypothetical protein
MAPIQFNRNASFWKGSRWGLGYPLWACDLLRSPSSGGTVRLGYAQRRPAPTSGRQVRNASTSPIVMWRATFRLGGVPYAPRGRFGRRKYSERAFTSVICAFHHSPIRCGLGGIHSVDSTTRHLLDLDHWEVMLKYAQKAE